MSVTLESVRLINRVQTRRLSGLIQRRRLVMAPRWGSNLNVRVSDGDAGISLYVRLFHPIWMQILERGEFDFYLVLLCFEVISAAYYVSISACASSSRRRTYLAREAFITKLQLSAKMRKTGSH